MVWGISGMKNKIHSMKWRIWKTAFEIFIETFLGLGLLLAITFILQKAGYISNPNKVYLVLDSYKTTLTDIRQTMKKYPYDFIVFDRRTGKIVASRYQKNDKDNYYLAKVKNKSYINGTTSYTISSNKLYSLVIRQNSVPEFTNPVLRKFSYNQISYIFLIIYESLIIIIAIYKLIHEISKNFTAIQKIALNMGNKVTKDYPKSKIKEFDTVLKQLYQKSNELSTLIETERIEKEDLSFQVAALSHDIKTPLTVLKGNIELLELTNPDKRQLEFMESMKNSIQTLENYFNTMINYTKLLNLNSISEEIDLNEFIKELFLELTDIAIVNKTNNRLKVKTNLKKFHANVPALKRALINIFLNACQYADKSNPQVSVTVTEDLKFLWFEIWNNGAPFSEEAQVNAQKLFFTEDKGRSGKHYGIGLSFAQAVAVRHGGTMTITNLVNDGVSVKLGIQKF